MTPHAEDRHPARRHRFWSTPVARLASRKGQAAELPRPVVAPEAVAPVDDGEDLLRRLREAGL
ncbi:MAG: hypothetical protein U1F56_00655 [Rubrivivax sp.]